jgi:NAD(P)H dehydrogenase (quinone)
MESTSLYGVATLVSTGALDLTPMRAGLTGASGQLGTSVLRHLLGRISATDIAAITRHPERLDRFAMKGVHVARGDFDDAESLERAFEGIERLLLIPGSDHQPGIRQRQHLAAIDAAVAAGVQHVVYVSLLGARAGGVTETHFITEQALMSLTSNWTVLRMSVFAETLVEPARAAAACGSYFALPSAAAAYVVRDDVAAAAAGILTTAGHAGASYCATGPASVTPAEIAGAISRSTGKSVVFSALTADDYLASVQAAGLPPLAVDVVMSLQRELQAGTFDVVSNDVEKLAGRRAESLESFFGCLRESGRPSSFYI